MRKYSQMRCVELFLHEWQFGKIVEYVEEYWTKFAEIKVPLIPDAGVIVGDLFYFTTFNTEYLYTLNLKSNKVDMVVHLPGTTALNRKFRVLVNHEEKICYFFKQYFISNIKFVSSCF